MSKLMFASDYQEGCHPAILKELNRTNMTASVGYGLDEYSLEAAERIRKACACRAAEVKFLIGGTQTNETVISAFLHSYEGVISADSGHVGVHEAGAIEHGGHKVLAIRGENGKITAAQIDAYVNDCEHDENYDHMVHPGMVYLSQPTEYGTLYSLKELEDISAVCRRHQISLYVDGARLAYALASEKNDVQLPDLARLCDVFYIGGTKCGALFGEAVVIPDPYRIPHFFTIIKQHGALLAKGRILGIQFNELFKNDLYMNIGKTADQYAGEIKNALRKNNYPIYIDAPTNQVFFVISNDKMKKLGEQAVFSFGEKYDEDHSVIRFATSWATEKEDVDRLCDLIRTL